MNIPAPLPRPGGSRDDGICYLDFTIEELMALINSIHAKCNPKLLKQVPTNHNE